MNSLPFDLLRPIVKHLNDDVQSLLAVSLASRALRVEGQRILFRTVALLKDVDAHTKFLTVVASSDLLASLVEEYRQFDLLDAKHHREPLWGLTCRGLQAMVNLKVLCFCAMGGRPSSQILRGCRFQLEVFRWESRDDAEQLLEFLPTQSSLRVLAVEWIVSPELNTWDICPGLQVLHGNQGLLDAFLAGRRIISLKWSPNIRELHYRLFKNPKYPQEFHYLRYFSYGGLLGRAPLSVIVSHLRVLEVLELIGLIYTEVRLNYFTAVAPSHKS